MPNLPTPQPAGIFFHPPHLSPYSSFQELNDELGNLWWLIDDVWILVWGARFNACVGTFEALAAELNPPGRPERAIVNGVGYRRITFKMSEEMPHRVGFVEIN